MPDSSVNAAVRIGYARTAGTRGGVTYCGAKREFRIMGEGDIPSPVTNVLYLSYILKLPIHKMGFAP